MKVSRPSVVGPSYANITPEITSTTLRIASPVTRLTLLEAVQSLVHSTLTEMNSSSEPAYSNKTAHTGVRELSPIHKLQFSSLEF